MKFNTLTTITKHFAADAGAGTAVTTEEPTAPAPAEPEKFEYDEARHFFTADKAEEAQAFVANISGAGYKVYAAPDDKWSEGAIIAVLPLSRNIETKNDKGETEKKRKTYAALVWPMHDLPAFNAEKDGADYIREVVLADQANRILNPLRRQRIEKDEVDLTSLPCTVRDHIDGTAQERGIVKSYMEACKVVLPALKKMHPAFAQFTPQVLRQYLQSAAMAKSLSPDIEAKGFWLGIIDKLEAISKEAGAPLDIYDQWRKTRNEPEDINFDNLSLDALSI